MLGSFLNFWQFLKLYCDILLDLYKVYIPWVKYGGTDLQSFFGSMLRDVHSLTHWLRPRNFPPPALGLVYEGAIGQQI